MPIRRVVTGINESGKSIVVSDGSSSAERALQHSPGFVIAPLWRLEETPPQNDRSTDPLSQAGSLLAPPGGAVFIVVTFPPDSITAAPDFDPVAAGGEFAEAVPGLAETFEPDHPGMHTTPTLDFATVVCGNVVLELDDGVTVALTQGDTVVQRSTRHAWRNPGSEPATVSFVMLGTRT
ncbi:cupin domain-containing protein [Rhizobium sp. FKY42]|uniref:cupin domain-containing protein n=1 Tax=Rhizobium sp. FKY42 TaxID=2562310 RepID=UPI0010C0A378|nr:cupin domain-containing protein [Rhizobium sp. FKY42]